MCAARSTSPCTRYSRLPIPRQPIVSVRAALEMIATFVAPYRRNETIVALLGSDYRPFLVTSIANTADPAVVVDIVDRYSAPTTHGQQADAMVVASRYTAHTYADPDRLVDRWCEISDLAEAAGVELLDWFVITNTIVCPRDLVGEPPRWPTG